RGRTLAARHGPAARGDRNGRRAERHVEALPHRRRRAPGDRLMSWKDALDERLGYRELLKIAGNEPVKGGARFAYVFGSALLFAITVQAITGWMLMTVYAPSAQTAWSSVHYITYRVSGGWFVRGLHHWGSSAVV